MKFFNIDLHISVVEDIKTIFSSFNHTIDCFSLSSHDWVFNRTPTRPSIITPENWKNIDDEMKSNRKHSQPSSEKVEFIE